MNKIAFYTIHKQTFGQENYSIYLSPEHCYEFTNKRKGEIFLVKISNYLTTHLLTLNHLSTSVYSLYRRFYFVLPYHTILSIDEDFKNLTFKFSRVLFINNTGINSILFTYKNIDDIADTYKSIIRTLSSTANKRKWVNEVWECNCMIRNIEVLVDNFQQFKLETKDSVVKEGGRILMLEGISKVGYV